jgi:hypothetical protein
MDSDWQDLCSQHWLSRALRARKRYVRLNRPYNYLIAAIGVADSVDTSDRSKTVTFEVVDGSGNRLGSKPVQYGQHQLMEVPLQGATSVTLRTDTDTGGCFSSTSSAAAWGNIRAVRS